MNQLVIQQIWKEWAQESDAKPVVVVMGSKQIEQEQSIFALVVYRGAIHKGCINFQFLLSKKI
jgi:hypothetical protein